MISILPLRLFNSKKSSHIKFSEVFNSNAFSEELDEWLLTTDYYLSYDLVNEEIMITSNADELISPASLTKLMTALLILDS